MNHKKTYRLIYVSINSLPLISTFMGRHEDFMTWNAHIYEKDQPIYEKEGLAGVWGFYLCQFFPIY